MEEGSLLQKVLERQGQEDFSSTKGGEQNVLVLDLFSLQLGQNQQENLLCLAELAYQCNQFLQSKTYLWHVGGDGPVFGVRAGSDGIPHLRAYCEYGPNVQDEWAAIDFMFQLSQEIDHDLAISCWDVDDGQVILIQTADVLPGWLDEDPSDIHRYACFIRNGLLQLLQHPHISLPDSIRKLRSQKNQAYSSHPAIQKSIHRWLDTNRKQALTQKTPFVVPRKIATMMRTRPDLVHAAIQAFCKNIEEAPPSILHHEDWVWTTHELARTNYAMARTMLSKEWESPEFLPRLPIEVKRFKRQCAMEATPHLKHAVQLGVRLVVGFEYLARSKLGPLSMDERIAHWCRLERDCPPSNPTSWILESLKQGPNHSTVDLSYILKCPVYPQERGFPTLYSKYDVSMQQQVLNAQREVDENEDFPRPLPSQIDDESWLDLSDTKGVSSSDDLDGMISKFQNFMAQPSGPEGVTTTSSADTSIELRPRVFMNILHRVLMGEKLSFPRSDAYFYSEDYDLMEQDEAENEPDGAMKGLMVRISTQRLKRHIDFDSIAHYITCPLVWKDAMDAELKGKSESRELDPINGPDGESVGDDEEGFVKNAHLLNNLLQSIEASEGTAGPAVNMLNEMNTSGDLL
eukprot:scaffold154_cov129-Cylindrotheca_fusiformis.AAC.36